MYPRNMPFILTIPMRPLWSVSKTLSFSLVEETTLLTHIRAPWWVVSSLLRWGWALGELLLPAIPTVQPPEHEKVLGLYGSAFWSLVLWQVSPWSQIYESFPLHLACHPVLCLWKTRETITVGLLCCTSQLNAVWKASRKRHQRCILAAAITDTALSGSIMYFKGCWSVTKVKLRPSR